MWPTLGWMVSNKVAFCTEADPKGMTAKGCLMTMLQSAGRTSFSLKEDLDSTSVSMTYSMQRREKVLDIKRAKEGIQKIYKFCVSIYFFLSLIMEPHGHVQPYHLEKQHQAPRWKLPGTFFFKI